MLKFSVMVEPTSKVWFSLGNITLIRGGFGSPLIAPLGTKGSAEQTLRRFDIKNTVKITVKR
jgi:hypothetical protein